MHLKIMSKTPSELVICGIINPIGVCFFSYLNRYGGLKIMSENNKFKEMDNPTLAAAGTLLFEGRQYEGIEKEKEKWAKEAVNRLGN
jgi:hypothetical protein